MRLQQIQLLKYGKFDGRTLDFPQAARDFHLVVGPNEAGKSTLRTAIAELLFGMPTRTGLALRHPLQDLRLGGTLSNGTQEMTFHRVRGKTPLRAPDDSALQQDALAAFVGGLDKIQFEQMFCLDHGRLVAGGKDLLDASKEVGRVLFQSAAGITRLGPVRDALHEQAGNLWATRRSSSEYAMALARLEAATGDLKAAQVRAKAWQEARTALDSVQEEETTAQDERRAQLERARRLGGPLLELRARQQSLAEMGSVLDFPATAMNDLNAGTAQLAAAEVVLRERASTLETLHQGREAITYDEALLDHRAQIETLEAMRSACANHARDLPLRQAERARHLLDARNAAVQVGWPADEAGMRARLPTALALKTVSRLLGRRGGLQEALRNSEAAVTERNGDLDGFRADLAGLATTEVPEVLRTAQADALTFRDAAATERRLQQTVDAAAAKRDEGLAALAPWRGDLPALTGLPVPSAARVQALLLQQQAARSAVQHAQAQLEAATADLERRELQLQQFEHGHKVVTPSEVLAARTRRDGSWAGIRGGATALADGAPVLDAAIRLADELVDAQLGSATDAAMLETRRQASALAQTERATAERSLEVAQGCLQDFETDCVAMLAAAGLAGLVLEDLGAWLTRREDTIARHATHAQCIRERNDAREAAGAARDALAGALAAAALAVPPGEDLATLVARATQFITAADTARTRREELVQRERQAERALETAQAAHATAKGDLESWSTEWAAALDAAGLGAAAATLAQAEGAVELASAVTAALQAADELQRGRIDTMQADLQALDQEARQLAADLAPELAAGDGAAISLALGERLRRALAGAQRATDADEGIRRAEAQADEARLAVQTARALLGPLLDLAGVQAVPELHPLVTRSDLARGLREDINRGTGQLLADGDGLTLEALEAEVSGFAAVEVPGLLEQSRTEADALAERMTELVQRRVTAGQAVAVIAGQANAAIAEAKRQEALATLGEVAERYLEAATAAKLLEWAINRYRDRKQDPMLKRASGIFSTLTLGAFSQLTVDYEKDVPTLSARRAGGQSVEVDGLSEGTRDQLFLALRIAAIELQIEGTRPMPFVADDLFVNFDDERASAGLEALGELSTHTQVIFLTHHSHLVPLVQQVFGGQANLLELDRDLMPAG